MLLKIFKKQIIFWWRMHWLLDSCNWLLYFFEFLCRDLWKLNHPDQWFLNLSMHQNYLEGLLPEHRLLGCTPRILTSYSWVWARESAFLTSSQLTLMLLAQGPHLWTANLESQDLIGLPVYKSKRDLGEILRRWIGLNRELEKKI